MTPSQEAREYPPLPDEVGVVEEGHDGHPWLRIMAYDSLAGTPEGALVFTADQMRSYVDSDRKARQQEALDARRYRWIRSRGGAFIELQAAEAEAGSYGWRLSQIPEAIDAAIDAALAKGPSHE